MDFERANFMHSIMVRVWFSAPGRSSALPVTDPASAASLLLLVGGMGCGPRLFFCGGSKAIDAKISRLKRANVGVDICRETRTLKQKKKSYYELFLVQPSSFSYAPHSNPKCHRGSQMEHSPKNRFKNAPHGELPFAFVVPSLRPAWRKTAQNSLVIADERERGRGAEGVERGKGANVTSGFVQAEPPRSHPLTG